MGILDRWSDGGPSPFELVTHRQDGGWVVTVSGEIDLATVGVLEAELARLQGKPIVLDLGEVSFIDSTGLTLLVRTAGRLTIGAVSPPVALLIETAGLGTELRFGA